MTRDDIIKLARECGASPYVNRHLPGVTQRKIAEHLGMHRRTIHNILARKGAYANVPKEMV